MQLTPSECLSKEEMIREEIQSLRDVLFRLIQWGVSVLVALQTALYFVRRDVIKSLIDRELAPDVTMKQAVATLVSANKLAVEGLLPWKRYIAGTYFLLFVSLIFAGVTIYGIKQYRHARSELARHAISGITPPDVSNVPLVLIVVMFLFFPAFDVAVRLLLPHA